MTDLANAIRKAVAPIQRAALTNVLARDWHLGDLSEKYESNGDPGAVSSGAHDPGGVSYGLYQLATAPGTAADFAAAEGKPFHLVGAPGSAAFSASWRSATRDTRDAFAAAQRAFIRRTHYDPAVRAVMKATGVNLDARCPAIRDATWSCAVQHGGAAGILTQAVRDIALTRGVGDEQLLRAIYAERSKYVLGVAARKTPAEAKQLREVVVGKRYPDELQRALALGGWA